jgi:hypothetical protein
MRRDHLEDGMLAEHEAYIAKVWVRRTQHAASTVEDE